MKRKTFRDSKQTSTRTETLRETARLERPSPRQINVRAAKDNLSKLLEEASRGNEIVITSDGIPKAKLVPMQTKRKRFKVNWELLHSMPVTPGPSAEEIIREERDDRP